jgi:hypothetical protein
MPRPSAGFTYPVTVTALTRPARLFIGSSSEGLDVARNLQEELETLKICDVTRWDQDVFEASGYSLDSLLRTAADVDFAVLIASPDDVTVSRSEESPAVRDNIILEFGLFVGAIGRPRTYLLATGPGSLKLPSDMLGLTRLPFRPRPGGNLRGAVNGAVLKLEQQIKALGPRPANGGAPRPREVADGALAKELELLCANAVDQGWSVKANSATTLRLVSPRGRVCTLSKGRPDATREELRRFAKELRSAGLRVNNALRRRVDDSPFE